MKIYTSLFLLVVLVCCNPDASPKSNRQVDARHAANQTLSSWNETTTRDAIVDFVLRTTSPESPDFIPAADRIACFDNDGTLWAEKPVYFQLFFAIDRIKALAPDHPEWKNQQPYKSLLENDLQTVLAGGEHAIVEIIMTTHAGMSTDEFASVVRDWIQTATHPVTGMRYIDMVYQPMLELLEYLRKNEFRIFIVSGGGVDFMRVWAEEVYGIPSHQIIGSSGKVTYQIREGIPVLVKLPEINFIDDQKGKPVGIHQHIGKRPVFSAGNSDGDYEMLQYTTSGTNYPRLGILIHHTDSLREWKYDRSSSIGKLEKGLDEAAKYQWLIVDMKSAWRKIYPD